MRTRHPETTLQKQKGFTIIELLLVVAILAILGKLSMPYFTATIESYRLNGAARRVAGDLRLAQSLAVSQGGIYGWHWGGDPNAISPPGASFSRVEKDTGTACSWPAVADTMTTNANVITNWTDLTKELTGITIVSVKDNTPATIGGVAFDSRAAPANPCTAVAYPLTITIRNTSGTTRTVTVQNAGGVRIQ